MTKVTKPIYLKPRDELAKEYIGKSKAILGQAEDIKRPSQFLVRNRMLRDGTRIKTYRIPRAGEGVLPLRIAKIWATSLLRKFEEACAFLSGFVDFRELDSEVEIDPETGVDRVMFLTYGDAPGNWERENWETAIELANAYVKEPGCVPEEYYPGSPTGSPAGWYSGRMRELVQMMHGLNFPVPYCFRHALTHGIWVGANGRWWVVEISASGVTAWQVPFCRALTPAEQENYNVTIPFIPTLIAQFPASANRIQLLSSSDMEEFAERGAVYSLCGWSFNSSGTQAVNTALRVEGVYKHSSLWMIQISGTDSPSSASITMEEESILWTPDYSAHFKYPAFVGLTPTLLSLITAYNLQGGSVPPADTPAPVCTYFDLQGRQLVWRVGWQAGESQDFDPVPSCTTPGAMDSSGYAFGPWSFPITKTTLDRGYLELERDGNTVLETKTDRTRIDFTFPLIMKSWTVADLGGPVRFHSGVYDNAYYMEGSLIHALPSSTDSELIEDDVVIFPFFERAAAYHSPGAWGHFTDSGLATFEGSGVGGRQFFPGSYTYECGDDDHPTAIAFANPQPKAVLEHIGWQAGSRQVGEMETRGPDAAIPGVYFCLMDGFENLPSGSCTFFSPAGSPPPGELQIHRELKYLGPEDNDFLELFSEDNPDNISGGYARLVTAGSSPQVMAVYMDTHHNIGPISAEMNGISGDKYHYIGNMQAYYPLEVLPENLWRAPFGVPNPEAE